MKLSNLTNHLCWCQLFSRKRHVKKHFIFTTFIITSLFIYVIFLRSKLKFSEELNKILSPDPARKEDVKVQAQETSSVQLIDRVNHTWTALEAERSGPGEQGEPVILTNPDELADMPKVAHGLVSSNVHRCAYSIAYGRMFLFLFRFVAKLFQASASIPC